MCGTDRHDMTSAVNSFQNKLWFLRVCVRDFLPVWITFNHFHQIRNCRLQTLSIWKSLRFVVWERIKVALTPNTTNQAPPPLHTHTHTHTQSCTKNKPERICQSSGLTDFGMNTASIIAPKELYRSYRYFELKKSIPMIDALILFISIFRY